MYKVCGMGLLISLFAIGCATPRQGIVPTISPSSEVRITQGEILKFYNWLLKTHQLVRRITPYHKTWPKSRRVHPKTHVPIPEPKPKVPPIDEIIKEWNELMKDPAFDRNGERAEMPAGSPLSSWVVYTQRDRRTRAVWTEF